MVKFCQPQPAVYLFYSVLRNFSWFIMCLWGLNATWGNEVLMHCGIDVCVWPDIVLCNGPVSGGGWGGQGVTGEKDPVWTALRVNIFAPTFTKDLTKKESEGGMGVSVDDDWRVCMTEPFQTPFSYTYCTHNSTISLSHWCVHELQEIHSSACGIIISGWDDFNYWLQSTNESGPDWNEKSDSDVKIQNL